MTHEEAFELLNITPQEAYLCLPLKDGKIIDVAFEPDNWPFVLKLVNRAREVGYDLATQPQPHVNGFVRLVRVAIPFEVECTIRVNIDAISFEAAKDKVNERLKNLNPIIWWKNESY